MSFSTVALVCFAVGAEPVCHETVMQRVAGESICVVAPADVAAWKVNSEYRGDQWIVRGFRCDKYDYQPRDMI